MKHQHQNIDDFAVSEIFVLKNPILNHDRTLQVLPSVIGKENCYLRVYILERSSQASAVIRILLFLVFIICTVNRTVKS